MAKPKIVDEMCYCGHLKSKHLDTVAPGHGRCGHNRCECMRFTWKSNLYASQHMVRRSRKSQVKVRP